MFWALLNVGIRLSLWKCWNSLDWPAPSFVCFPTDYSPPRLFDTLSKKIRLQRNVRKWVHATAYFFSEFGLQLPRAARHTLPAGLGL